MNKFPIHSDDDLRFDRLVDGELSPEEYRQLLATLDDDPGAWRRCALAFLEAQALGQELSAARRESAGPTLGELAADKQPRRLTFWNQPPGLLLLAAAASILVAFGLGLSLGGWQWPDGRLGPRGEAFVKQPRPQDAGVAQSTQADLAQRDSQEPVGNVSLVVDGGQDSPGRRVDLPVYDSQQAEVWSPFERSAVPADVRQALERLGHRVEQRQQLVPVDLRDGRQVVVPVEQYRIVPVSRPY